MIHANWRRQKTKNDTSQGPISDNPARQFTNAGRIEMIRIK